MNEKKNMESSDDNKKTPEIPDNEPNGKTKPIKASTSIKLQMRRKMKSIKFAYALSLLILFGAALTAKLASEQSAGNITVPIESSYLTYWNEDITLTSSEEPDYEVRQNVTNVPDTGREDTVPTEIVTENAEERTEPVESSPYAEPYKDYYCLPLGTDILKDYSPTTPSYNTTLNDWRTHGAVDFSAPDGSQVKAIAYGTVSRIYEDALYGTVVEIDHGNDVIAKYCGMNKDALEVDAGDTVESGSLVGYLGTVPCEKTEESHLHFEICYKGENVDPLALMNK